VRTGRLEGCADPEKRLVEMEREGSSPGSGSTWWPDGGMLAHLPTYADAGTRISTLMGRGK
jgi:hypothetical protein